MTNLQVLNIYASIFFGHFASIIVDYLVFPNMCYYLSQVVTYFPARIELAKFAIHFWKFCHPTYTKPELIWIQNMKVSHLTIIMDDILVVHNICPNSAIFLCNNLTYQICDILWHFGPATYTKPELIWIGNMKLTHFAIIIDEFLLVPNICPSSVIFLFNHLTYQICDTLWHFGPPT